VTKWINVQLEHVDWIGFRFEDLIMPLFMFLVGVVMPFSFQRRLAEGNKAGLYRHILIRVAILWILGMIAQGNLLALDWSKLKLYSNTSRPSRRLPDPSIAVLHFPPVQHIICAVYCCCSGHCWPGCLSRALEPGINQDGNLAMCRPACVTTFSGRRAVVAVHLVLSSITFGATVLTVFSGQFLQICPALKAFGLMAIGLIYIVLGCLWGLVPDHQTYRPVLLCSFPAAPA
jgi:hypothetical protein